MRAEKLHAVAARNTFPSQKCKKTDGFRALLEVARSTCPSQKCKKLTGSDHFWKCRKVHAVTARSTCPSQKCKSDGFGPLLEVSKSARRSGAKHISRSKCTKLTGSEMSKKYTLFWHEAHFQVKMH